MLNIQQAEKTIGVPVSEWPGNCYAIASQIVEAKLVPGGAARYGHYYGPCHKASRFYDRYASFGFCPHGWIEQEQMIFDPTRWVFECKDPYIYHREKTDDYDIGGNRLRAGMLGAFPENLAGEEQVDLWSHIDEVTGSVLWHVVADQTSEFDPSKALSLRQVLWFSNAHYAFLGPSARPLYMALIEMGLSAFIPLDNRTLILGD